MIEVKLIEEVPSLFERVALYGPFWVSIAVLGLAGAQVWLARMKRRDDLSERRITCILAVQDLLARVKNRKGLTVTEVDNFLRKGGFEGTFLFGKEVGLELATVLSHAVKLVQTGDPAVDDAAKKTKDFKEALAFMHNQEEDVALISKMRKKTHIK